MEIYVGKYVRIKSLEWFNLNRFNNSVTSSEGIIFSDIMAERFCSNIYSIESINNEMIKLQNLSYTFSREFFDETYDSDTHDELIRDLKVGDKVLIKSFDWYIKNRNNYNFNRVFCESNTNNTYVGFTEVMSGFCNTEQTIESITVDGNYRLSGIKGYIFTNTMFTKKIVNKSCKYKIGDIVKVRSIAWYNCYRNAEGSITCGSNNFISHMKIYCGCYLTIKNVFEDTQKYYVEENSFTWTDEMFEGKVVNSTYEISNPIKLKSENADKDNETKETTAKTNVLPDNKTKLIIIKDVPLNLKIQSEVKIHLKPKTIHYESYNT